MMISLRIPRVSGRRVIFAGSAPAMHAAACRISPELAPAAAVLAAARRVLDSDARHLHAYMPNAGHPRVREAVAARLSSATGLPYTANHVLMTVGAGAALNTVLKALLDPGDEVVTV